MTYAQGVTNLGTADGVPFVTIGSGAGFDYGPVQNPTSTTFGHAEAISAVTTSTNSHYGYAILAFINGQQNITGTFNFPSQVNYINWGGMPSGEGYNTVLTLPNGYLNYTGSVPATGYVVQTGASQTSGGTVKSGNINLTGFALTSSVAGISALFRITACHQSYWTSLFICSLVATTPAFQVDALANSTEAHGFYNCFFSGDIAMNVGTTGDAQAFNDSAFYSCVWEPLWTTSSSTFVGQAGNSVIVVNAGNNVQLYNPYIHGDTGTQPGALGNLNQTITAASNVTTTITIDVPSTAGLNAANTQQTIRVAGATPSTWASINGIWTVTSFVANTSVTFSCNVAPTGSYSANSATLSIPGQVITAVTNTGVACTISVGSTTGVQAGQPVYIAQTAALTGVTNLQGSWLVTSFVANTSITFNTAVAITGAYTANSAQAYSFSYQMWLTQNGEAAPSVIIYNGEHEARGTNYSTGWGQLVHVSSGTIGWCEGSISIGEILLDGGTIIMDGRFRTGGAQNFMVQTNLLGTSAFYWGEYTFMNALQYQGQGGNFYPPAFNAISTGAGPYGMSNFVLTGASCGSVKNMTLTSTSVLIEAGVLPIANNFPTTATEYVNVSGYNLDIYVYATASVALSVKIRPSYGSVGSSANGGGGSLITPYNSTPPIGWSQVFNLPQNATITFTSATIADFTFVAVGVRT
jgi:hypothetical protein